MHVKSCVIEVNAKASDLEAALAGEAPLSAALPGKTTSIYDTLGSCL
jgi:hypothetical protein